MKRDYTDQSKNLIALVVVSAADLSYDHPKEPAQTEKPQGITEINMRHKANLAHSGGGTRWAVFCPGRASDRT